MIRDESRALMLEGPVPVCCSLVARLLESRLACSELAVSIELMRLGVYLSKTQHINMGP